MVYSWLRRFVTCTLFCLLFNTLSSPLPALAEWQGQPVPLLSGAYAPYSGKDLEGGGVATQIVRAVFKEVNIPVTISFYPWKRGEIYVEDGLAFATFAYIKNAARKKRFAFTDSLLPHNPYFFYYRPHHPQPITSDRLTELAHYRIGAVTGYWYEESFKQAGITPDYVDSDRQNFMKIVEGRIDLLYVDERLGWYLVNKFFPDQKNDFAAFPSSFESELETCLMVSRKYPNYEDLIARFNAGLKVIRSNGVYQQLVNQGKTTDNTD
ncbi:substrate-binding periplasmic protein [Desulforhopalus sp. 52FAK]